MDWLIEPFRLPFMQTAALAAILVGITCAAWRLSAMRSHIPFCRGWW
jgi:ABC-type Mn2+/Zn2+ transport system permease subunit